ncbi:MAG TPA: serine/threonine-protein kinase, partial [Kofleriaceae bacterium]
METGSQIGPFVVLRLLGKGGMGSVYLAEHTLMKDLHAIKILDPQLTQNPAIVTRFVNEARAAARLRHRNLVRVHNIERLPDDGSWFMVLDYLDGRTLARFMAAQRGPMPPTTILHILAQVANCIEHVHDHKIVHRDLKPDNIFLIQHGDDPHFPVVLDLGVAQLSEDLAAGPATKTGTVIGTPIYMAPEQLRGERVSPAADIFALGVIAYEMSTGGFFPYQYDEPRSAYFELPPTEIYYRQRSSPPVDPRRRCPGLGDAWVDILRAALDPDPRVRPPSAGAFARMLAAAVPASQGDGHAILHQVARELTQHRGSDGDLRGSGPAAVLRDAG